MFLFILPSVLVPNAYAATVNKSTVLVCYGRLDPASIKGYSLVILESENYNAFEIKQIKSQNEKVLAYISLGEVNKNAVHYKLLKDNTLGKNTIWDSYYLNLKAGKTTEILMQIIGETLQQGYDGFFLDNIDNYTSFGPQPDQKTELVNLLKTIYTAYPDYTFVQNAGLDLISETAPYIDAVVIESIASNYTFNDKKYKLRDEADYQNYVAKLKAINTNYNLPVILIEYADTVKLRDDIEKRINNLGYEYFIGQINLQAVPKFSN
ncbi:MAG TPA: endo alpha-1,4 polygalactosaminidase [Flavobacterium sp.]|nr:endo alpha-1,4 polygalactosaminidase [Flavobacterium sp.]